VVVKLITYVKKSVQKLKDTFHLVIVIICSASIISSA
jgi:hypothetical protein